MQMSTIGVGRNTYSKRSTTKATFRDDDDDDDYELEEQDAKFSWSVVIFIPFNTVFMLLVLVSVICKTMVGPLSAITPELYCSVPRNDTPITVLSSLKPYFNYVADPIYFIDTFLHIVHKQVEDKAKQREHLPKSSVTILLDIMALIPLFRLMSTEECANIAFWPNILNFNQFLLIYRVIHFFRKEAKNSIYKNMLSFFTIGLITLNAISCFWLLLTHQGFCKDCHIHMKDWRSMNVKSMNRLHTKEEKFFFTYFAASGFFASIILQTILNNIRPMLMLEILIVDIITASSYLIICFFVIPKLFAEACILTSNRYRYQHQIVRVVSDINRRDPASSNADTVLTYYHYFWIKRNGILKCPSIIKELPRYLSAEIKEDLCWPVFYHSPILRRTSAAFKRWICDFIHFEYRMPGQMFFYDTKGYGNLYYIKTGIAQLISSDDQVTPLLSVSGGTIFGDINFFVPALYRKVSVRCLTYCEVYTLPRKHIYAAMAKFAKDRAMIMYKVSERLKHAQALYRVKKTYSHDDRAEDENLIWLKKRWWTISYSIKSARKKASNITNLISFDIPAEDTIYHCSKYIGQLVLCDDTQLQSKSTFVTAKFPWIFVPDSTFSITWEKIIKFTVYLVLFLYPPTLINRDHGTWFSILDAWVDFSYILDVILSLLTAPFNNYEITSFTLVMFTHCKNPIFILDVLSTPLIDELVYLSGMTHLEKLFKFNRLIKIYVLFVSKNVTKKDLSTGITVQLAHKRVLAYFSFVYISCFFVFLACFKTDQLSHESYFCFTPKPDINYDIIQVFLAWVRESPIHAKCLPDTYRDISFLTFMGIMGFILKAYNKTKMMSAFYLNAMEHVRYQYFVRQLTKKYETNKIHHTLYKRLEKYIQCHWRAYDGLDMMRNGLVHDEPYDIYWKGHGEMASKILSNSTVFAGVSDAFIKEIVSKAHFLVYPKKSLLYLYGCPFDTVSWLVNGELACVYPDGAGKPISQPVQKGEMISIIAVFFGKFTIRTFVASTDVEVLYIKKRYFDNILKRYPIENAIFNNCIEEYQTAFNKIYLRHLHDISTEFQRAVRQAIYAPDKIQKDHANVVYEVDDRTDTKTLAFKLKYTFWIHPESRYYYRFIQFRIVVIYTSIIASSFMVGSGVSYFHILWSLCLFNNYLTYLDMVLKLFLAYYNEKGLIIYDWRMRFYYYLTHSFVADAIGSTPWARIVNHLAPRLMNAAQLHCFNTVYRCAHIYLLNGYLNYKAYWPSSNLVLIMILKWQLNLLVLIATASQYYMTRCVEIDWTSSWEPINIVFSNKTCWFSKNSFKKRPNLEGRYLTVDEISSIFAESFLISIHALMRGAIGRFHFKDTYNYFLMSVTGFIGAFNWFLMTYFVALLVLNARGLSLFHDSIVQLEKFLKAERIEQSFIDKVLQHYKYVYVRTKGVAIQNRYIDSIGSILRQDLNYFFYKGTLEILGAKMKFGAGLKWILAFYCDTSSFLEGADIMREDDIVSDIYIVHRGAVTIFQNNRRLATLEQGSIFGHIESGKQRPVKVTAKARDNSDILLIPWVKFHSLLTPNARKHLSQVRTYPQDYIYIQNSAPPDPYNSIRYIMRGSKVISYPWMRNNTCSVETSKWFAKWLLLVWVIEPFFSSCLSLMVVLIIPLKVKTVMFWCLLVADSIALFHTMTDYFYGLELVISGNVSVFKTNRLRKLMKWTLYVDIFSVLIPNITIIFGLWWFQLARLVRIRNFYVFFIQCRFQSRIKATFVYFVCVTLAVHALTWAYIVFACQNGNVTYYLDYLPDHFFKDIDNEEWTRSIDRELGCQFLIRPRPKNKTFHFTIKSKHWYGDYLVSLSNIIQAMTLFVFSADLGYFRSRSTLFIKAFIYYSLFVLDLLIISKCITVIYIKYRKRFKYEKMVKYLLTFLKCEGISPTLEVLVQIYMKQLWDRQKGNWLPELAYQAPQCLREDIMGTLYIHHLQTPHIFHDIPHYFLRQLVARFHRVVIFPGKYIVRAGDILARLYFIHEGDVEKHYVNSKGEIVTTHLLTTNGYFGFVPGMPPDMPFACSYYTRTVVDAVYLKIDEWKDLINIYEDVKLYLEAVGRSVKHEL